MSSNASSSGENSLFITSYWPITTIQHLKTWCNSLLKETIWRNSRTFHSYGRMKTICWKWSRTLPFHSIKVTLLDTSTFQTRTTLSWCTHPSNKRPAAPTTEPWCKAVAWKASRTWKEPINNNKPEIEHKSWLFLYKISWWRSSDSVKSTWWRKL